MILNLTICSPNFFSWFISRLTMFHFKYRRGPQVAFVFFCKIYRGSFRDKLFILNAGCLNWVKSKNFFHDKSFVIESIFLLCIVRTSNTLILCILPFPKTNSHLHILLLLAILLKKILVSKLKNNCIPKIIKSIQFTEILIGLMIFGVKIFSNLKLFFFFLILHANGRCVDFIFQKLNPKFIKIIQILKDKWNGTWKLVCGWYFKKIKRRIYKNNTIFLRTIWKCTSVVHIFKIVRQAFIKPTQVFKNNFTIYENHGCVVSIVKDKNSIVSICTNNF